MTFTFTFYLLHNTATNRSSSSTWLYLLRWLLADIAPSSLSPFSSAARPARPLFTEPEPRLFTWRRFELFVGWRWIRIYTTEVLCFYFSHVFAADASALGRHLLWRRGCLCVGHVDVLCPNDWVRPSPHCSPAILVVQYQIWTQQLERIPFNEDVKWDRGR